MIRNGNLFIIIGLILMLGGAGLMGYNLISERNAGKSAAEVLDKMSVISEEPSEAVSSEEVTTEGGVSSVEIDGDKYIGILKISSLGLDLPVMKELDYPKLRIAPCRYKGSVEDGGFIIAGHNYKTHFGRLKDLKSGDEVCFTDVDGNVYNYTVSETELINGTDVSEMESGDWDLSLFTCNFSGACRVTVRCKAV